MNDLMKELIIEAQIENLNTVLNFVTDELETIDCPMKLQMQISIAVEEIFVNIAQYAYEPETGKATIRVNVRDEIVIEFEDKGKPYNPLDRSDPVVTIDTDGREIGGLGIFMVKNIMDSVEYFYESGKNILLMKKKIS